MRLAWIGRKPTYWFAALDVTQHYIRWMLKPVKIDVLSSDHKEAYDNFLAKTESSLLYYSSQYRDLLLDLLNCEQHYLLASDSKSIRGVMPLLYVRHGGRRLYNSLPYYGSNGGILAESEAAYHQLALAYASIAQSPTTIASTSVSNPFSRLMPSRPIHNHIERRINQCTHLSPTDAEQGVLMSRIDSSARRNVKKALANGITVAKECDQLDRLRAMHQANMRAIGGLGKSTDFFAKVPKYFSAGRDYDLYVARRDNLIVAALLVFYFGHTAEYFTPVVDEAYRTFQPLALILINAMSDAARQGVRRWNWGATWPTQTGVYRFKRKWAAIERNYNYYCQLNDESLLDWTTSQLQNAFPGFFVVPYTALRERTLSV